MKKKDALVDLLRQLEVIRRSLGEPTDVQLDGPVKDVLGYAASRVSNHCTALVLGLQGASCTDETARSGCKIVEESLLRLLTVHQVVRRDQPELVWRELEKIMSSTFASTAQLVELLQRGKKADVSPGTGLVWRECDRLSAFNPSVEGQVAVLLDRAERCAVDTVDEMQQLKGEEDAENVDVDEDDLCSEVELLVAGAAVGLLKAAKGCFKGAARLLKETNNLEGLAPTIKALSCAIEDLGCSLYPPQDPEEVQAAATLLQSCLDKTCQELLAVQQTDAGRTEAGKLRNVCVMLSQNARQQLDGLCDPE